MSLDFYKNTMTIQNHILELFIYFEKLTVLNDIYVLTKYTQNKWNRIEEKKQHFKENRLKVFNFKTNLKITINNGHVNVKQS